MHFKVFSLMQWLKWKVMGPGTQQNRGPLSQAKLATGGGRGGVQIGNFLRAPGER